MLKKVVTDKLSIYIPQDKQELKPVERLTEIGKREDRSINYLVVKAIIEYIARDAAKF